MKRKAYIFEQITDMDNLRLAFYKAQQGKSQQHIPRHRLVCVFPKAGKIMFGNTTKAQGGEILLSLSTIKFRKLWKINRNCMSL
jgi:hypothetical protein